MKNPFGDIGKEAADKHVREALWPWEKNKKKKGKKREEQFTPEGLLSMAWSGEQPWVVEVDGEALQVLKRLAALEEMRGEEFYSVVESVTPDARGTLLKLWYEGSWYWAMELLRHPATYGPVGDVLDLRWTKEGELHRWIAASTHSWSAYEGVKKLLDWLIYCERHIPDALARWSADVALGVRKQPPIGHRPADETYRDAVIVQTIRSLTATPSQRKAGIRKLSQEKACELVADYLGLGNNTVWKIWKKSRSLLDPRLVAPAMRPF